jgi:hypothetical protein
MKPDEYLNMINSQVEEARKNMMESEKKHREDEAKYMTLLSFKQNYIKWIGGTKE